MPTVQIIGLRRITVLVVVCAASLALGSCSGGGDQGPESVSTEQQKPAELIRDGASGQFPRAAPQLSGKYYDAVMATNPDLYWRLDERSTSQSLTDASGNGNDGYVGDGVGYSHASPGEPGAVDDNDSTGFDNPTPAGQRSDDVSLYGRAYDFAPFRSGAAITVAGIARNETRSFGAPFETLFGSETGTAGPNDNATLEVRNQGDDQTVRWYSDVGAEAFATWTDFPNAWPADGSGWVHWLFTFDHDGRGARLWINGQEKRRVNRGPAEPMDFLDSEGVFQIANRGNGSYEIWNGELDEIVVWQRVLSEPEIDVISAAAGVTPRR